MEDDFKGPIRRLPDRRRSRRITGSKIKNKSPLSVDDPEEVVEVQSNQDCTQKLNDDCLHEIFMNLPIRDRMRVERVCKRWKYASEQGWPDVKSIEIYKYDKKCWGIHLLSPLMKRERRNRIVGLNFLNVKKILVLCGRFLSYLVFRTESFHDSPVGIEDLKCAKIVAQYCHNLTSLRVCLNSLLNADLLEPIISKCQKVETLEIEVLRCGAKPKAVKCHFWSLQKLPKERLKKIRLMGDVDSKDLLTISTTTAETIRYFFNLHTLIFEGFSFDLSSLETIAANKAVTTLELDNCRFVKSIVAISNFENLLHLTMHDIEQISDDFLCQMAMKCQKLKYLKITSNDIYGYKLCLKKSMAEISKLPCLQELHFNGIDVILGQMGTMPALKAFSCSGGDISKLHIISLVEHAENLESLNIINTRITRLAISAIAKTVSRRTNGIVLTINMKDIHKEEFNNKVYSPLLKIE